MISAGFEMQVEVVLKAVFVQSSSTANHVFIGALSLFSVSICSDVLWIKLLSEVYPRVSSVVGGLPGPVGVPTAAVPMRTKSSCSWGSSGPAAGASAPDSGDGTFDESAESTSSISITDAGGSHPNGDTGEQQQEGCSSYNHLHQREPA